VAIPSETVIIAGPTGAGKTALALGLAQELSRRLESPGLSAPRPGVEIVGADAYQIYAGLPLLTAQPTAAEQLGIPHHLVGSIDPSESFDAGRYQRTAEPILQEIAVRGAIPLLVGGTGLYLKALLGGLDDMPGNDPALRAELALLDLSTLVERLSDADPDAPAQIDLRNRRRVERALEIILLTGKPLAASRTQRAGIQKTPSSISDLQSSHDSPPSSLRALLVIRDREELNARIAANVVSMFERGVEAEVAALPEERVGATAAMTLGLREIRALLRGEISRAEAIEAITTATRRYAKRQMTWFKNQHDFPILNLSEFSDPDQAVKEALRLLRKD
jgi:tRNA dimethylallyltransferase